jgi:putative acetyltransferase
MLIATRQMPNSFTIRPATPDDAEGILLAHYSAVHETAKQDYSEVILHCWSKPVNAARIAAHRAKMEANQGVISLVAVNEYGTISGFAELVPPETLGAIYVAASAGRRGVASTLLTTLEGKAREIGMTMLRMDSSLTAAPFYIKHGFHELSQGTHTLTGGLKMPCIRMEKKL